MSRVAHLKRVGWLRRRELNTGQVSMLRWGPGTPKPACRVRSRTRSSRLVRSLEDTTCQLCHGRGADVWEAAYLRDLGTLGHALYASTPQEWQVLAVEADRLMTLGELSRVQRRVLPIIHHYAHQEAA